MHPSSEFGQNLIDVYAKVQRIQGLQEVHQLDFAQGRERVGSDIYPIINAGTTFCFSTVSWCLLGSRKLRLTAVSHRALLNVCVCVKCSNVSVISDTELP